MLIAIPKSNKGEWNDLLFRVDEKKKDVYCGYTLTPYDDLSPETQEYGELNQDMLPECRIIRPHDRDLLLIMAGLVARPTPVPPDIEVLDTVRYFFKPFGLSDDEGDLTEKGQLWADKVKLHYERQLEKEKEKK